MRYALLDVGHHGSTLALAPSGVLLGRRYGYTHSDADQNPVYGSYSPVFLFNVFALYRDVAGIAGLDAGAGVYNVFDTSYTLAQAYASGHAPMPTLSRDFLVKLAYYAPF
jgi:hypothetical protein